MASLQITPPLAFLKPGETFILPILRWDIGSEPAVYFWYRKNDEGRWKAAIYDTDPDVPHKFSGPTDSSPLGQRNGTADKEWRVGRYVFIAYSGTWDPNNNPQLDDPPPLFRVNLVVLRDAAHLLKDTKEDWGNSGTQINAYAYGYDPNDGTGIKQTHAVLHVDTREPVHPEGNIPGRDQPYPPSWLEFPRQSSSSPDYIPLLKGPQPTAQKARLRTISQ